MRAILISICLLSSVAALAEPGADELARAKDHFRRGNQLYDIGKYLDAAAEYRQAFELSEKPAFLFNIAQAYRLGNNAEEAIAAYRGFLRRIPDAAQRAEVEEHIEVLSKRLEADRRAKATPAPSLSLVVSRPAPVPVYKKWWLWTTVGIVAAGAATGIAVGITLSKPTPTMFDRVMFP